MLCYYFILRDERINLVIVHLLVSVALLSPLLLRKKADNTTCPAEQVGG